MTTPLTLQTQTGEKVVFSRNVQYMANCPDNISVQILVSCARKFDERDEQAFYKFGIQIFEHVEAQNMRSDPNHPAESSKQKLSLLGCFPIGEPIYVETIPNGYCHSACCEHLPWFVVTTRAGRITIGWRKRVIHLGWEKKAIPESADQLFPGGDMTKEDDYIHAWGYEKAAEYIKVLLVHSKGEK